MCRAMKIDAIKISNVARAARNVTLASFEVSWSHRRRMRSLLEYCNVIRSRGQVEAGTCRTNSQADRYYLISKHWPDLCRHSCLESRATKIHLWSKQRSPASSRLALVVSHKIWRLQEYATLLKHLAKVPQLPRKRGRFLAMIAAPSQDRSMCHACRLS